MKGLGIDQKLIQNACRTVHRKDEKSKKFEDYNKS